MKRLSKDKGKCKKTTENNSHHIRRKNRVADFVLVLSHENFGEFHKCINTIF